MTSHGGDGRLNVDGRWRIKVVLLAAVLYSCVTLSAQNSRPRRDISSDQPKIVSQNGHLIFQTAENHNITFKSSGGGSIMLNGEDLIEVVRGVQRMRSQVDEMQARPPTDYERRIRQLEDRIGPTSGLSTLFNRLSSLSAKVLLIETAINSTDVRNLQQMVTTLNTQVGTLNNLLTQDECRSDPCRNGGTCLDLFGAYTCQCLPGWTGRTCANDVNECYTLAGTDIGCQHGATCTNTQGSFTCLCPPNWYGARCTEQHDDCLAASVYGLCAHGTCQNLPRNVPGQANYKCFCEPGWTNNPGRPECNADVNECAAARQPCSVNPPVQCMNTPGSFHCGQCPPGYSGNGFTCLDIDECAVYNGYCSLAPRVPCINTLGSRQCGPCPPGYNGDGISCTYVGLCGVGNGGCHPLAQCRETPGIEGRSCQCPTGYYGNGIGYTGCTAGVPTGGCANNPCNSHGDCVPTGSGYTCVCSGGWTGTNCNVPPNPCSSSPCRNRGTCAISPVPPGFTCRCTDAYTGPTCQEIQEVCGGRLRQESGSISFPRNSTQPYPHGANCVWTINTMPSKIIMLTFVRFNTEAHSSCDFDFLQIFDGPSTSSHSIGRYCGSLSSLPNNGQINSTGNYLYLWFKSDASVSADGFELNWSSAVPSCGGNLVGQQFGVISSPGYPGNYPNNRDCMWRISVETGNTILFTFGHIALEHHDNCSFDYLEVRDGLLDSDPVLQRFCSTRDPPPIQTSGPYANIRFHSDYGLSDRGFQISYTARPTAPSCGGRYTDRTSGTIMSPDYPDPYPHDAQCFWSITVPVGEVISLTFTNVDLEQHANCVWDYVEVRDGVDEMGSFVGRYCGNSTPPAYTTSSNNLWIKFHSDMSNRGSGFRATWRVACGGVFTAPSGELKSPYFPNRYPNDKQCDYVIRQPEGSTITLSFITLDIEASGNGNCSHDYLEIRNGETADSPLASRYCGSLVPAPLQSSGNVLFLRFESDGSVQNYGFRLTYQTSNTGAGGGTGTGGGSGTAGRCGGSLTGLAGVIQSPMYPNTYPHGVNCSWFITVTPGYIIRLTFTSFSLEAHYQCAYDYVQVFDNYTTVGSLGKYCGSNIPPALTSTDNVLVVLFVTDASVAHEGFAANYIAINSSNVCGGELRDTIGLITSPNYPLNYPHNRQCEWIINLPTGRQILLNITDFVMESHSNCQYDYLEIRDGGFLTSPLIGRYCGTSIDRTIRSHSNRLFIKMSTDSSAAHRGFRISYDGTVSGCGGSMSSSVGSFVSPNYPLSYGRNADCAWNITVSLGSFVRLHFVDFDLETHVACAYDYVQVRENGPLGNVLAQVCGNSTPEYIESRTNSMWVKFRTDFSNHGRGFYALYYAACNNVLTAHTGVIESPNFPNPYPRLRNCTWTIMSTLGNTVNASFTHFEVEGEGFNSSCRKDYVELRDGTGSSSQLIGRYCGHDLPPRVTSQSRSLVIRFVSDASVSHNGFRLEYILDGCGGRLAGPSGNFTSIGYPQSYPPDRECVWIISVQPGSRIRLTIYDFDVEAHPTCDFDAFEIFGGIDETSPRLIQLCHSQSTTQTFTSTGSNMYIRFRSDSGSSGRGFNASYDTIPGGCGGNYSTRQGTIMSANYPQPYDHYTDCIWIISGEGNRPVILTFLDFDIESHTQCAYDYVAVYATSDYNTSQLMKACGNSLPSPASVRSVSNVLYVRLRSDGSVAGRGFKASFATSCGGVLDAEQDGQITSPGWPNNYERNANCSWIIQAAHPGDRITLTFTHIDVEDNSDNCSSDYVRVLEGSSEDSPQIGTYCGTTVPPAITSVGLSLVVKFVTDYSMTRRGFQAFYTKSTSACGGDFTSEHGAFNSPRYPEAYINNIECVWTITASLGNRISISFSFFNLEQSPGCVNDYVEIRESTSTGRLVGRYCGNQIPVNQTVAQRLWVRFRSNENRPAPGFMAQYNSLYGGSLTGNYGQLASPLYPGNYPNNAAYEWTIWVSPSKTIRITFQDMDLEMSQPCTYDYVQLLDGISPYSPVLGTFCGITIPDPVMTSSNQMRVKFRTDISVTGRGFLLTWQALGQGETGVFSTPATPSGGSTVPGGGTTTSACGGNLTASDNFSTLTSPGFPYGYANNLDCYWTIMTPVGSSVMIQITNISLESHSACRFDYVSIVQGSLTQSTNQPLGRFCGFTVPPNPIVSTTNFVFIRFHTDSSANRSGFALRYKIGCGGVIESDAGVLTSPRYPANYGENLNCTWTIKVSPGRTVRAQFTAFAVAGQTGQCADDGDFVELFNGESLASPTISRLCGTGPPLDIISSGNYLTVNFRSNSDGQTMSGFRLQFNVPAGSSCGGSLSLTRAQPTLNITSPNYPSNYPMDVDCMWTITAPPTLKIKVEFVDVFELEDNSICMFDYVELRDGGTENSPVINRFCGTSAPIPQTSTGNLLWIRFRSDESVPKRGFRARLSFSQCGGTINARNGTLMSPNYPQTYPAPIDCEWRIQTETGHFISFTFEDLSVGSASSVSQGCLQLDYVQIAHYTYNSSSSVLATVCGSARPQAAINTSDNIAVVRFHASRPTNLRGFKLNFVTSLEACGGMLTTPSGVIRSPNYPGQYAHNRTCTWTIRVPEGRRVSVTFDDMDVEDPSGIFCRRDFVEIRNGLLPLSPIIGRYCGTTIPPTSIESSSNGLALKFVTDGSVSGRGFSALYHSNSPQICGDVLNGTDMSGIIESPGFSANISYNVSEQCIWILTNRRAANSSVAIFFNTLDLEAHGECQFDFVEIREGGDQTGHLIGHYCQKDTVPPVILSPYSTLWIRFVSDLLLTRQGFQLRYNYTNCGGVLTNPNGYITSPGFPLNYARGSACSWKIEAPQGTKIRLNFNNFAFGDPSNCTRGNLEVFNGPLASSPSIGKFCSGRPPAIVSQSNALRLQFQVESSAPTAQGFRIQYAFVRQGCGGNIHAQDGTISSPNYPESYNNSIECIWDVVVEIGYHIKWEFASPFNLESSTSCNNDFVEIYEVYEAPAPMVRIGRYCGTDLPSANSSSTNKIRIKFRSNSRLNGNGFSLNFTAGCGATFRGPTGTLMSPGYPRLYGNDLNCTYEIIGDPQKNTILTFNPDRFRIEGNWRCRYDYVEVFVDVFVSNSSSGGSSGGSAGGSATVTGGGIDDMRSLGRFCGQTAPQPLQGMGRMVVQFITDESVRDQGWMATYQINDCGGVFTSPTGSLSTPTQGTTSLYSHNANCTWIIVASQRRVVQLRFETLSIEPHSACLYDYVAVYNGELINPQALIGKYCGSTVPQPITSSGNKLLVNFVSDASDAFDGFTAEYTTVYPCGGRLNATSGELRSLDLDGDGQYENNLDCIWRIIVPGNSRISFQFTSFNLEPNDPSTGQCRDFVQIRDGMFEASPIRGVYCGNQQPSPFNSTSNVLYLRFVSNEVTTGTGFVASYNTIGISITNRRELLFCCGLLASTCGGTLLANITASIVRSPGFPNSYQLNQRCVWTIEAPAGEQVEVELTTLNMPNQTNCDTDYVELTDEATQVESQSVLVCATNRPAPFISTGRRMDVKFVSGSVRSPGLGRGLGFQLTYKIASCNKNYTSLTGLIVSPRWPANYPINARCEMRINTGRGLKLSLYFGSLAIEPHPSCQYDYLEVYNSSAVDASRVALLCGAQVPNPIFLSSNTARLLFVTDDSEVHSGFEITYTATPTGCGGDLRNLRGAFTSPSFPDNLATATNCQWRIFAPTRSRIRLQLRITPSRGSPNDDCTNSAVVVYDGATTSTGRSSRYCRVDNIAPMTSSSNSYVVVFSSSASTSSTNIAFRAFYTVISQYVSGGGP